MLKYIEKAAAFCIVGPDDPKIQKAYVKERDWKARLYSVEGTSFIKDMGFEDKDGNVKPGISILKKGDGGKMKIIEQCRVDRDGRAPSVLEVFWMLPDVEVGKLAWR